MFGTPRSGREVFCWRTHCKIKIHVHKVEVKIKLKIKIKTNFIFGVSIRVVILKVKLKLGVYCSKVIFLFSEVVDSDVALLYSPYIDEFCPLPK